VSALNFEIRGRGRDLVLLHGWSLNLRVWDSVVRELMRGCRVIAIDLPGHGKSDWDASASSPAAQAWRVHETLAPLTERYALVGWSLGGQFALDLAAAMPAGIERLVLVSTTPRFLAGPGWPFGTAPALLTRLAARVRRGDGQAVDEFLALQVRGNAPRTAARVLKSLRSALARHGAARPEALAHGLERLRDADLRPALPMVRVPALVVAGTRDRIVRPGASRALAASPLRVTWNSAAPRRRSSPTRSASRPWWRALSVAEAADAFRLDRRACAPPSIAPAGARGRGAPQVGHELLGRLGAFAFTPAVVLDLGAGTGRHARELRRRYPRALVVAVDLSLGMLKEARHHQRLWRRFARACGDAARLPLASGSVDLVFSNLMLQWCQPPDAALAEVRRVLRPGGFLAFSTFGPATLQELRSAWAHADGYNHVNHFLDVHDVGAALVRAGLTEPVLDVDRHEVRYPDTLALMRDLKAIGAHNVTAGRPRSLLGRSHLARMSAAYEQARHEGTLPATFEVVYGAAWGAAGRAAAPVAGAEARIAAGSIRRRDRA
jgi:malonyl-CoA O-methyltransferase